MSFKWRIWFQNSMCSLGAVHGLAEACEMSRPLSAVAGWFCHRCRVTWQHGWTHLTWGLLLHAGCSLPFTLGPAFRPLRQNGKGKLLFWSSSMLPGQSTSCNNSVSPGHWQGSWVHGFLLMWLQGLFRSFPNHSLPAVVVQAHLCPVSLVGSAQLLVGPCDTWAEGSGMVWGALPDSPTNW